MQTTGKTVLITGGGSGIGLALAKEFLSHNSQVIICGRSKEKLEKAKKENSAVNILPCDVTNKEQIQSLLQNCNEEFGGIDILVNNAGIYQTIDLNQGSVSLEQQIKEVDIGLNGPIRMVHYFLPELQKKPEAAIINVSGGLAFIPLASAPVYCATKAAIHSWTQSLRWQLASTNVKVFELIPPLLDTGLVLDEQGKKNMAKLPKVSPEKMAEVFLKNFQKDKFETTHGQSSQLKNMRRMAPNFIFKMMNKG